MKKRPTKSELAHMMRIKELPCIVEDEHCGGVIECHHITSGGRRLGHFYCLSLCQNHHEGTKLSIGNTKKTFVRKYGSELELLKKVRELINN